MAQGKPKKMPNGKTSSAEKIVRNSFVNKQVCRLLTLLPHPHSKLNLFCRLYAAGIEN